MIQRLLQQKYGIHAIEEYQLGPYEACQDERQLYLLMPVSNMDDSIIEELDALARYMVESGDSSVFFFQRTKEGEVVLNWESNRYCVMAKAATQYRPIKKVGRKLAKFHHRGRAVPFEVKSISRIGMWKTFWEQRLDQLEKVWNERLFQEPENEFERMFIESFPYYMGLAENAIQYISDTEQDDEPSVMDSGTICHARFSVRTWGDPVLMKNPFDWVFDHCSRDLAEWTRARYFYNIKTYEPEVRNFYQEYKSMSILSSFSWRLLYARLLFPLHYFESVEEYHITSSEQRKCQEEDKLKKYLEQSKEYEEFLKNFYTLAEVPVRRLNIPRVDWL